MVCTIRRVWPGEKRTAVIVIDRADTKEKYCFVWTDSDKGQEIARLCDQACQSGEVGVPRLRPELVGAQIVLTVKPKHRYFGYEIEDAEVMGVLA